MTEAETGRPEPERAQAERTQDAPVVPAPRAGIVRTILGRDQDDDDSALPDLPPLPADPRWRIEHLPFVTAVGLAFVLCAASIGFLAGGPAAALGAAAGVLVVTVGVTLTTLVIAYADALRPALVLPFGVGVYVIKYSLILFLMFAVASSHWAGARPMVWGLAVGAILITGVQVWWLARLARRNTA